MSNGMMRPFPHGPEMFPWCIGCSNAPRHNKTNKMSVRPAKTQISLRSGWSESSLCSPLVAKDPSFLHADSEDSDQSGRMPRSESMLGAHSLCWFCHVAAQMLRGVQFDHFLPNIHKIPNKWNKLHSNGGRATQHSTEPPLEPPLLSLYMIPKILCHSLVDTAAHLWFKILHYT